MSVGLSKGRRQRTNTTCGVKLCQGNKAGVLYESVIGERVCMSSLSVEFLLWQLCRPSTFRLVGTTVSLTLLSFICSPRHDWMFVTVRFDREIQEISD